ncbi:MAG: non-homologous end-joining DNA ligase [Verrucomicrobia bacterium]|nr:non-homologous end-joining DNA ligase [Verrucomicrobiota bacterium]
MGLTTYRRKRDFDVTAEPAGTSQPKAKTKAARFVIQKHDATRLHYDFRLEMEGVLKSWAIPKGLPWAQAEKHLAVEVEDHPIEYGDFEGIIPEGQYGGGTVMLWDRGTYEVTHADSPLAGLRAGKFHVILHGKKAQGEWAMIRIRPQGDKNQWLLMKTGGSVKPLSSKRDDESVKTGRTMKQIAAQADAEWQSNRVEQQSTGSEFKSRIRAAIKRKTAGVAEPSRSVSDKKEAGSLLQLPKAKAQFIEPMKPRLVEQLPAGGNRSYELKFDGIRALAVKSSGRRVQLISRNEKELNKRFPEIAAACEEIAAEQFVIDGEVVAVDEEGRSSFQLLQRGELDAQDAPLLFYAFDLLQMNGRSLLSLPLTERKQLLGAMLPKTSNAIRFSGELPGEPQTLLEEVKRRGLEGLIGKQRDSVYEPGRRSGAWIKIKCVNEQEFVIGGYTPPAGSRKFFGALLVGYYDRKRLLFAGKVGTGFDAKSLAELYQKMRSEKAEACPFADLPSKQNGQWVQGITPGEMRRCTWVKPKFVCQIKFAEWTRDLKLRQPVFLGLREDKAAREVVRENGSAGA